MTFDIDTYSPVDFSYKSSFSTDLTEGAGAEMFEVAKDFVKTYFYGIIYDLIPRCSVPEDIKDLKAKIFTDNAIAWYLTDFFGSETGALSPTTGLLPISQKNIGGVFVGFAVTASQDALKALESNKFGIMCRDMFYSFKERYAIYV